MMCVCHVDELDVGDVDAVCDVVEVVKLMLMT